MYTDKQQLIATIRKSASLYLNEFSEITDSTKDIRIQGVDRTPYENMTYQLGWMDLLQQWERTEQRGNTPEMPAPDIKWNQLGALHQQFYATYRSYSIDELKQFFSSRVEALCHWLDSLEDTELFQTGGRRWAQSTPSNWPVWKWVHINTVAPFKSFRTSIRKWKRLLSGA